MSGEFAREFPKVAGRLTMDSIECADPYIERLIESFAYLSARVQMKLEAEFPRFTQSLLETVLPHYLAPTPSMAVVRFEPDFRQDSLNEGFVVPRGTVLRSIPAKGDRTPCRYLTSHEMRLHPLAIAEAGYHTRDMAAQDIPQGMDARAAIRIRIKAQGGRSISDLKLDSLVVHLRGVGETSMRIYEQVFSRCLGVVARPFPAAREPAAALPPSSIRRVGYSPEEAMLPFGARSFQGYRLLAEYFNFPDRFMFIEFTGLSGAAARCASDAMDLLVLLGAADLSLEGKVSQSCFELHCTPAVNLFPMRTDRIHVTDGRSELHVMPDRTRPLDFEVYSVGSVTGYGAGQSAIRTFRPFFGVRDTDTAKESGAYFVTHRAPRVLSERQYRKGSRLSYAGSEVFVSLVDSDCSPYSGELQQLGIEALCTNRDLPQRMPLNQGKTDFVLDSPAPVQAVRCVGGPTEPNPSRALGSFAWRLVSHLSLNYLSLADEEGSGGAAAALREMLSLYIDPASAGMRKQVDGLAGVSTRPIVRRVLGGGAIAFARGLEVTLKLDESCFEGTGAFLFGAVLERFFARHVTLNSFTETVVETLDRGQIMRWTPRIGQREII